MQLACVIDQSEWRKQTGVPPQTNQNRDKKRVGLTRPIRIETR